MSKIALVSPYSWTYPGWRDPPHRGAGRGVPRRRPRRARARPLRPRRPARRACCTAARARRPRPAPDYLVPLGRTVGYAFNGAVSNLVATPYAVATLRRELRTGGYDVAHVHEPVAPVVGWDALASAPVPLVGTFHCFSENVITNNVANLLGARRRLNMLRGRIAVSEAAAWTGRRFYGGRYRVIPNGVAVPDARPARERGGPAAHRLRRPGRRAQGPARAAARLRGAARARAGRAADRRRHRGGGVAAAARRPRRRGPGQGVRRAQARARSRRRTSCARPRWAERASAWS